MPKDDLYYSVVKQGLTKLKWSITHDPYPLSFGNSRMFIDLGVEKIIGAEKGLTKIAIEIKSFLDPSPINDFHKAIGQYISYQTA